MHAYLEARRPTTLIATHLIRAYQRYLSPIKGYSCAYLILYGGPSCSTIGIDAFAANNFSDAVLILRSQFADCHQAALELKAIGTPEAIGVGCCGTGCSC